MKEYLEFYRRYFRKVTPGVEILSLSVVTEDSGPWDKTVILG